MISEEQDPNEFDNEDQFENFSEISSDGNDCGL
mgnify:CR=1 FL=1